MAQQRRKRAFKSAPAKAEPTLAETGNDDFDVRRYLLETGKWFDRWLDKWPPRAIKQFEEAGFVSVRLERVEPHPVWQLRMKCPDKNLTSTQAGRMIRTVVKQAGKIPRAGFFCYSPRQGVVEANFVLEV